ncbi:MAG: PorP/SprF family type IX secretion system membrane protein [Saprospiraceae bacterium]|nr:PorP/SprF family type IX secretion system membrane protein [Saprospiraceae bacterium]
MRYINSIKSGFGVMISDLKRTASVILVIVLAWCMSPLIAQDPVYSQFYNAHLQLNAAMAGNTRGPLIQMNYRNQWPGLGNIYTTYSVSYDQYISKLKSGLGFILLTDNAGDGVLRSTGLTGFYSYRVRVRMKSI